jgi:electron transport complex protein RnfA
MSSLLVILLSAVLVCHYAPAILRTRMFVQTDEYRNAQGMALGSALLIAITAPLSFGLRLGLNHLEAGYLHAFALILVIMTLVQVLTRWMPRWGWTPVNPAFSLTMTTHCAVFGVALLCASVATLEDAIYTGLGCAAAFAALLLCFHTLHRRTLQANVPVVFRDVPLALISAGLMALALMGLIGLVRE